MPFEFYGMQNWSTDIKLGRQQIYGASENVLNEMAEALNSKDKLGPILVGPPGSGKTEMARAFAAKVAENKYPGLKGKTVFYLNTTQFAHPTGVLHFQWMISQLEPFKDRIVFIFDEAHTALAESPVSDAMKTELEGFQVICITTDKEISKVEKDGAFMARLARIDIKPPQGEDRQEAIADIMRIEAPKSWVAEGAIECLETKLSELSSDLKRQMGFRCEKDPIFEVFRKCVALLAKEKKSPLEKELESKKSSLETQKNLLGSKSCEKAPIVNRIRELQREISSLQERVDKEKEDYTTFLSLVNRLFEEKKVLYQLAVKGKSSCSEKELSLFDLINSTYIPNMEAYLLTKASELKVDVAITSDLIERVFENFKKKIPKEDEPEEPL